MFFKEFCKKMTIYLIKHNLYRTVSWDKETIIIFNDIFTSFLTTGIVILQNKNNVVSIAAIFYFQRYNATRYSVLSSRYII